MQQESLWRRKYRLQNTGKRQPAKLLQNWTIGQDSKFGNESDFRGKACEIATAKEDWTYTELLSLTNSVFRIRDILIRIRIIGSVYWITDQDPALFGSGLKDANKKGIHFKFFWLISYCRYINTFLGTFILYFACWRKDPDLQLITDPDLWGPKNTDTTWYWVEWTVILGKFRSNIIVCKQHSAVLRIFVYFPNHN